ncbi:cytoskeletal protein binding protein, partial [Rhizopus stolonifer]
KEDDDWWKTELKQNTGEEQGPIGLVPATYLEEVQPIGRVRAEYDYVAQQEEELSFEEGDEMVLLEKDDPDWFLVKSSKGDIGLAPSNYVISLDDHQPEQLDEPPVTTPVPAPPAPPAPSVTAPVPPPPVQPILSQPTGSTTREIIADEAQSWNVQEYDPAKKKKKKGKGSLFIGNGMICYGSETDKASPVQQYPILDVTKYLYDGKNLHIEIEAEGGDELSVEENEQLYVLDYERTDGWWRVQKVEDKEEIRRRREEEERALYQQRLAEEEERERIRRHEQEENERKRRRQEEEEEEKRRKEEERRREEEEKRRQAQEAAKRAELARQKQLEEDYKRKEAERKATLARSASKSNRHQDLPKPDSTKIRTWTDRSGSFKVEAQFIDYHNGKLRLHKLNGVKIDVPVEKMCADDIRWVEEHTRQPKPASPEPTPAMPPRPPQEKKFNDRWDWFDWFMLVGIPMQASLQYASAFKAEKLDDSDIQNLTHKQMKTLGLKEEHVQRIQRYIETGKPEASEQELDEQKTRELQIAKDEEYARKLQSEIEAREKPTRSASVSRPKPSVSAPKDVHPDLLDFI